MITNIFGVTLIFLACCAFSICAIFDFVQFFKSGRVGNLSRIKDKDLIFVIRSALFMTILAYGIEIIEIGWSIFNGQPHVDWDGYLYFLFILAILRLIFALFQFSSFIVITVKNKKQQLKERLEQKLSKMAEREIIDKTNRKAVNILLDRVRKESDKLIPFIDEHIAEIVEALRNKANAIYNHFNKGEVSYNKLKIAMEEIISDLITIEGMVHPATDKVTYSDLLGVPADASNKDVKKAYVEIMKIIHPDLVRANGGNVDRANNLSRIVNLAYDKLTST